MVIDYARLMPRLISLISAQKVNMYAQTVLILCISYVSIIHEVCEYKGKLPYISTFSSDLIL